MFYSPETHEPRIESQQEKPLKLDYSGKAEWQAIVKKLHLDAKTISETKESSPEVIAAIIREGNAIEAKEMLLDQRDIFDVEEEIDALFENKNFSIPYAVMREMLPIHQYFEFLRQHDKASFKDERAYFEYRYGWADHPDSPFFEWDQKLASLNRIIRAHTCGVISDEEFRHYIETL